MTAPEALSLLLAALDEQQEIVRARLDADTEREEIARDEETDAGRVQARGDA